MKLKNKEVQNVNNSVLLRRGNKIITGSRGRTEKKKRRWGAKMGGKIRCERRWGKVQRV